MAYIIFDFDGTLADMKQLLLEVGNEIAVKRGWPPVDEAMYDRLSRGSIVDGIKQLGIPLHELPYLLIEGKRRLSKRTGDIKLFPGIDTLIQDLSGAGHQVVVLSTNSRKLIQEVLERNGLASMAEVLPSSSLFGKATAIRRFIRRRRLGADQVWMVGDELRDIEAGKKANVHTVAVTWGLQHPDTLRAVAPDFIVDQPKQISHYISE
jgi:phosphoglycolate phosphatase